MDDLVLYTRNDCVQCKMTKKFLTAQGVSWKEINIDEQPEYIDYLKEQGHRQTPVVAIPGEDEYTGFRPDRLKSYVAAKKAAA